MKNVIGLFMMTASLIPGNAVAQQPASQATRDMIVREIQDAAKILGDALVRGDARVIGETYADGFVHIDQYGTRTGKQERLAEIGSGQRRFLGPLAPGEDAQYEVHGDTVVVTGRVSPPAPQQTFKEKPISVRPTVVTRVWRKRDGRWQVILTQVTPIIVP
jgi:ketosteroid isomerase-like protein